MNKIILGDSLEIMRDMADNQFDLVLTDPPYGIGRLSTGGSIVNEALLNERRPRMNSRNDTNSGNTPPHTKQGLGKDPNCYYCTNNLQHPNPEVSEPRDFEAEAAEIAKLHTEHDYQCSWCGKSSDPLPTNTEEAKPADANILAKYGSFNKANLYKLLSEVSPFNKVLAGDLTSVLLEWVEATALSVHDIGSDTPPNPGRDMLGHLDILGRNLGQVRYRLPGR